MEARSIFRNVLEQVWTMVSAIYRGGGETLLDAGSAPPRHRYWIYLRPYLICLAMDIAATGVAYLFEPITAASNLSLVYLPPILISALSFGLWPSIASSMLGVLLWDYLFLPPKYELNIDDPQDALALLLFLVISLVVSNLAALSLRQRSAIEARAKSTAQLYEFSQQIAAVGSLGAMLNAAISTIGSMMHCEVFVLLTADGATRLSASYPQMRDLDAVEVSLAQAAATGAPVSLAGRHLFMPLQTQRGIIGVVGIDRNQSQSFLPDEESLLSILVDQTAVAIERIQLAETIDQARIETETERLRNAMLTSISHDLRTPLTSIMAAHSILRSLGDACDAATRQDERKTRTDRGWRCIGIRPRTRKPLTRRS
jgi:two-component system sensor histidine kinase KdpD